MRSTELLYQQFARPEDVQLHQHLKEIRAARTGAPAKVKPFRVRYGWIAVAAALALLVGVYFFSLPKESASIAQGYYEPYRMLLASRGSSEGKVLNQAIMDYQAGEFSEAAQGFEEVYRQDSSEILVGLYQGVSLLGAGQAAQAALALELLLTSAPPELIETLRWYLALAWVEDGKLDLARTQLQAISREPYLSKAERLLSELGQ